MGATETIARWVVNTNYEDAWPRQGHSARRHPQARLLPGGRQRVVNTNHASTCWA